MATATEVTHILEALILATCFLSVLLVYWKVNDFLDKRLRLPSLAELWRYEVAYEARAYRVIAFAAAACAVLASIAIAREPGAIATIPPRDLIRLTLFGSGCTWVVLRRAALILAHKQATMPTVRELFIVSRRADVGIGLRVSQWGIGLLVGMCSVALVTGAFV